MNKFMALVVVFGFFVPAMFGQNYVEQRTLVSAGTATPRIDGLLTQTIKGQWGSFEWFQADRNYADAYAGGTFSPRPWVQFALGAGLEQDRNPARVGGYAWFGNKRNSALVIAEDGGSGFWNKVETLHTFNRFVDAGFIEERFKGSGAEIKVKIPRTSIAVWAAPVADRDPASREIWLNAIFGIRWSL